MDNSASTVNNLEWDGRTLPSLVTIRPPTGSVIECEHCHTTALTVVNDCIVVTHRHHGQWHKSIIPLNAIGYVRIA